MTAFDEHQAFYCMLVFLSAFANFETKSKSSRGYGHGKVADVEQRLPRTARRAHGEKTENVPHNILNRCT